MTPDDTGEQKLLNGDVTDFKNIAVLIHVVYLNEPRREKTGFLHMRKQRRETDQRLCFRYTDSTSPLLPKPKLQASRHLLWLYCPVCVGPGRKPRRPVFSERGSNIVSLVFTCMYSKNLITVLIMRVPQVTTLKKAYQLQN